MRDYGSGSIRRRADGRWEGRLSLGTRDGRRQRKFVYGTSRRQIILKLQEVQRAEREGRLGSSTTLRDFLKRWLTEVIQPNKQPWTYREYEGHVRRHIVPALGHIPLDQLEPAEIQRFLNHVRRSVGPSTAWHCRKDLMAAIGQAVRWRLLRENVVKLTEPVRVEDREPTIFDREQCGQFLAALVDEPLGPLFAVSLTSALRPGELLALTAADVDLIAGTVHVRRSLAGPTKTHRSKRPLPLSTTALTVLRALPVREGLLFRTSRETVYDESNVARVFKRILRKAGLPNIRFYDLRHSFASLLESEGVPVKTLQELMGHARSETTLRYYVHSDMAAKRGVMGVLDRLLTPVVTDNSMAHGGASRRKLAYDGEHDGAN